MNFEFPDQQHMIQAGARESAQNEIAPLPATCEASGEFPVDTIREAGDPGFFGLEVPWECGCPRPDTVC